MSNEIMLPEEVKKELAKTFKIDRRALFGYLKGEVKKGKAPMIRAAAEQRGGREFTGRPRNLDERFYDGNNMMVHKFSERVWINVYFDDDGNIDLYVDDIMVESHNSLPIPDFMRLQERAEKKAIELLNQ